MVADDEQGRSLRVEAPAISAVAVGVLALVTLMLAEHGPLSRHMLGHIATMNILAPLLAASLGAHARLSQKLGNAATLWSASLIQMALLWTWHSPSVQHVTHVYPGIAVGLHAVLLLAALAFWCAVIASAARPWQTILALLLSGKLACLLGALLVFSPRLLVHPASAGDGGIADQHLAGLLMLSACLSSYILAAIVITAQAISSLHRRHAKIHQDRSPIGG